MVGIVLGAGLWVGCGQTRQVNELPAPESFDRNALSQDDPKQSAARVDASPEGDGQPGGLDCAACAATRTSPPEVAHENHTPGGLECTFCQALRMPPPQLPHNDQAPGGLDCAACAALRTPPPPGAGGPPTPGGTDIRSLLGGSPGPPVGGPPTPDCVTCASLRPPYPRVVAGRRHLGV
jgi:hypothetical protein